MDQAIEEARTESQEPALVALNETSAGFYLEFLLAPGSPLPIEKLENQPKGVEVLTSRVAEDGIAVLVFLPHAARSLFADKISAYLSERRTTGNKRLNRPLIDAIEDVELGTLASLWAGRPESFPEAAARVWWEIWLRAPAFNDFERVADRLNVRRYGRVLRFIDRVVVLAYATAIELEKIRKATGAPAELRPVENATVFMINRDAELQLAAAQEITNRTAVPEGTAPAITILDNGVNNAHPLIGQALSEDDLHAIEPNWPLADNPHTHGSAMAGLALYDDLSMHLVNAAPIILRHRLESVRILPPAGHNDPALYGAISAEAVARVETEAPDRKRVFCLAVTAPGMPETGRPSSWSAELDRLSSDGNPDRRLFVVAVGNVRDNAYYPNYLVQNTTAACESPSQSWNALSVGAFTNKTVIDDADFDGWSAVAPAGELAPSSRTSTTWNREWPIKPEVLFEGGNWALDPDWTHTDTIEPLSLLTTSSRIPIRYFEAFGDTSAATALGAKLAANVVAEYPDCWAETIRGLIVHSAQWTGRAQQKFDREQVSNRGRLLRMYGYGVPDLERAMHSARNELTLVSQSTIKPFKLKGSNVVSNEIKIFSLPWPVEALQELGPAHAELRVTLSYFVEPNPAERGWRGRHRYRSHGLRFKIKRANESMPDFEKRINQAARDEDEDYHPSVIEQDTWYLGPKNRDVGSIHSDFLIDSGANLAERGAIAVHPVSGWWKERKAQERFDSIARFSLIVSLRTDDINVNIYTPVLNQVAVAAEAEAE